MIRLYKRTASGTEVFVMQTKSRKKNNCFLKGDEKKADDEILLEI